VAVFLRRDPHRRPGRGGSRHRSARPGSIGAARVMLVLVSSSVVGARSFTVLVAQRRRCREARNVGSPAPWWGGLGRAVLSARPARDSSSGAVARPMIVARCIIVRACLQPLMGGETVLGAARVALLCGGAFAHAGYEIRRSYGLKIMSASVSAVSPARLCVGPERTCGTAEPQLLGRRAVFLHIACHRIRPFWVGRWFRVWRSCAKLRSRRRRVGKKEPIFTDDFPSRSPSWSRPAPNLGLGAARSPRPWWTQRSMGAVLFGHNNSPSALLLGLAATNLTVLVPRLEGRPPRKSREACRRRRHYQRASPRSCWAILASVAAALRCSRPSVADAGSEPSPRSISPLRQARAQIEVDL